MRRFIHATLLIVGTSIGAGFLALPLSGCNLDIKLLLALTVFCIFIAYRSSMMAVELNELCKTPASMDVICRSYTGKRIFALTLTSIYLLSFSLLTGYFSCFSDTFSRFCSFRYETIVCLSACGLFGILSLNAKRFADLNSSFVCVLLAAILMAIIYVGAAYPQVRIQTETRWRELPGFLPIIFTSFIMQTICPRIYGDLAGDRKKISRALILGISVPGIIYMLWVVCVLKNITAHDTEFLQRLRAHEISVGELIGFLCDTSPYRFIGTLLKILTLLSIMTSAIGFAIGLLQSLQVLLPKTAARLVVCLVPATLNFISQDMFVRVFAFSGAIATVFMIFVPYYLIKKQTGKGSFGGMVCCIFGVIIVACELGQAFL
ncbi:MAG: hypothetical protein IJ793_00860 [Opitutales bacterium]|nr:hypothetical protein [Opitutales bacterium]